jgi:AmmeMemoRadiSam system protein A
MSALTDEDKDILLKLARSAITSELIQSSRVKRPKEISPALKEKRGCFVTLHKRGVLRGCIGTIEPVRPLFSNVEENAISAAFNDPRFPSLTKDELSTVDIEVSVLTAPEILHFEDGQDLMLKIKPGVHGVILSQGWRSATFLPQVWEQLPEKKAFLENLCLKGGMDGKCWQDKATTIKVYEAEYFSE